jgi:hypothetical protein
LPVDNTHIYAAITADIVGSTQYYEATGKPMRPRLLEALERVNRKHHADLAVPFTITLGDEFQCLALSPSECPHIINDIRLELYPLRCRAGVGIGTVVSELVNSSAEMEGVAFAFSREALDMAKHSRDKLTLYRTSDERLQMIANTVSGLIDVIQGEWSDKQWEAVKLYTELGDMAKVGNALGIRKQSVDDRLKSAYWQKVAEAMDYLAELLDNSAA